MDKYMKIAKENAEAGIKNNVNILDIECLDRDECIKVFEKYKNNNGIIY